MWSRECDIPIRITVWFTNKIALTWHCLVELIKNTPCGNSCCAWLWKLTPTWCWHRYLKGVQCVLVIVRWQLVYPYLSSSLTQTRAIARLLSSKWSNNVRYEAAYLLNPETRIITRDSKRRNGPLTRYVKLQVAYAPGMPGTFYPAADFKGNR